MLVIAIARHELITSSDSPMLKPRPARLRTSLAGRQHVRELGARLDLSRAEEALAHLDRAAPERGQEQSALTQLLTLRLAEAVAFARIYSCASWKQ